MVSTFVELGGGSVGRMLAVQTENLTLDSWHRQKSQVWKRRSATPTWVEGKGAGWILRFIG